MKEQDFPLWFRVLEYYEKNGYYDNGLTIPYLIGCNTIINPTRPILSLTELLNEFQNIHKPEIITIFECGNIGEFVVAILDYESKLYYTESKRSIHKRFNNILVLDSSLDKCSNINQVISIMKKKYQFIIQEQKFSKNDGVWTEYTEIDRERLSKLK